MYPVARYLKTMGLADPRCHKNLRLYPLAVEAALRRRGPRHLTLDEQKIVMRVVKDPAEVTWPEWWRYFPARKSSR